MGLQSKFFYLPPSGEAYIYKNTGYTFHSFQNIDQALDFASKGKVDATYQVKKIDFQTHKGEDLAVNTATSLEDSPLARFLGDNAHSLTAMEGTDYAVGKNELRGERSLNIMEGYLFLEKDKNYRFKSVSDDGIRIKIGDKVLFNDEDVLKGHHDRTMSKEDNYQVDETGFYKMDIAHYDIGWGNATLKLFIIENDNKEVVVGDYENGGIPLFTDISDMGIIDGKPGKIVGYEAQIAVETDLDTGKTVDLSVSNKEGNVTKIETVTVEQGNKIVTTHVFDKIPAEDDVFKAEYKDTNGEVTASDTTNIKESNTEIVKAEPVNTFGDPTEKKVSSENTHSQNDTEDTSSVSTDEDLNKADETANKNQNSDSETINMGAVSSLSEQTTAQPISSNSGSLLEGILSKESGETIPGLENSKKENIKDGSDQSSDKPSSLIENSSETEASSVTISIPMSTEDTIINTSGL